MVEGKEAGTGDGTGGAWLHQILSTVLGPCGFTQDFLIFQQFQSCCRIKQPHHRATWFTWGKGKNVPFFRGGGDMLDATVAVFDAMAPHALGSIGLGYTSLWATILRKITGWFEEKKLFQEYY